MKTLHKHSKNIVIMKSLTDPLFLIVCLWNTKNALNIYLDIRITPTVKKCNIISKIFFYKNQYYVKFKTGHNKLFMIYIQINEKINKGINIFHVCTFFGLKQNVIWLYGFCRFFLEASVFTQINFVIVYS